MCGCCSRAASWISRRNRSRPSDSRELGAEHLERDVAVVPEVVREVDGRHAAGAELALDDIPVGQNDVEARSRVDSPAGHFGFVDLHRQDQNQFFQSEEVGAKLARKHGTCSPWAIPSGAKQQDSVDDRHTASKSERTAQ